MICSELVGPRGERREEVPGLLGPRTPGELGWFMIPLREDNARGPWISESLLDEVTGDPDN